MKNNNKMVEKWIDCILHVKVLSCVKCSWVCKMKTCSHGWYWQVWLWWSGKTKSLFRANSAKNGTRGTGDQVYKHFFLGFSAKKRREVAWSWKKVRIKRRWFFWDRMKTVCLFTIRKIHLGGRNRWCMKSRENSWGISLSGREWKRLRKQVEDLTLSRSTQNLFINNREESKVYSYWCIKVDRKGGVAFRSSLIAASIFSGKEEER